MSPLIWTCPRCSRPLNAAGEALRCAADGFESRPIEGVRDFRSEPEVQRAAPFLAQYQARRQAEGRGSLAPRFYLGLPSREPSREWQLRTRGLTWLRTQLPAGRGRTLDAGAGCCWLSRHLAQWGYEPVALDINDDPLDGLRAGRHYERHLGLNLHRSLAPFERLPFADRCFESVIFNASFHYAADQEAVLAEAVRVTQPGAPIVILDSPLYLDVERSAPDRDDSAACSGG